MVGGCPVHRRMSPSGDFLTDLVVKILPSDAGGTGSISGQGIKIPHAMGCRQKKKKSLVTSLASTH